MDGINDGNLEPTKISFSVVNLNNVVEVPIIVENGKKEWVEFGEDNLFFEYLINIFVERSITHRAVTDRKIDMISANGFDLTGLESQAFKDFLLNNNDDDTLEDVTKKITMDYEVTDSFAIGVIWDVTGTKITQLYHIPIQSLRYDKDYYRSKEERYFWMAEDWSSGGLKKSPAKRIQEFSTKYTSEKTQVYYFKKYSIGNKWYSVPKYYGSLNWFIAEYEIAHFHKNAIMNGFSAGFLLSFNSGVPTPEEMKRAYREIQEKFTGPNGAGKFILAFSNGTDQKPELTKIDLNDSDKRYTELNDLIRQNIFVAHNVINPMLYGVFVAGQLGGRLELEDSLGIYQAVYIDYRQRDIENVLNKLARINGIIEPIKLKKYKVSADDDSAQVGQIVEEEVNVSSTALNGAQISSLNEIIANITNNVYPSDTGLAIIKASFPFLDDKNINAIIEPLKK
jgi:hypothetical protein